MSDEPPLARFPNKSDDEQRVLALSVVRSWPQTKAYKL